MGKFYGEIGFRQDDIIVDGVAKSEIIERFYTGDVLKNDHSYRDPSLINEEVYISNTISIVADPYAHEYYYAMKYVVFQGIPWKVTNIAIDRPRIVLTLGGMYNGERPEPDQGS